MYSFTIILNTNYNLLAIDIIIILFFFCNNGYNTTFSWSKFNCIAQ